jgi:hypothetical protein
MFSKNACFCQAAGDSTEINRNGLQLFRTGFDK